jgi:hypothetical protein
MIADARVGVGCIQIFFHFFTRRLTENDTDMPQMQNSLDPTPNNVLWQVRWLGAGTGTAHVSLQDMTTLVRAQQQHCTANHTLHFHVGCTLSVLLSVMVSHCGFLDCYHRCAASACSWLAEVAGVDGWWALLCMLCGCRGWSSFA